MKIKVFTAFICMVLAGSYGFSSIELVTVPKRDSIQLTIYNSADLTMVREKRTLTFKKGLNRIQFSWAGTLIDPTSLRLTFKENRDKLDLMDTTFPPGRDDALQWNIQSQISGPVTVEIVYFTSGISWEADYVIISSATEDTMDMTGYVKVINNSGEDYPNAQVRLVVGTINLVERISDLAKGNWKYRNGDDREKQEARSRFKKSVGQAEMRMADGASTAPEMSKPKEIIKEGLSEYFLFSIEGYETIPNGWQKRLRSLHAQDVPLTVIYRVSDTRTQGYVNKFYEFFNKKKPGKDAGGQLGESPLPDGSIRIFSRSLDNLSYMGSVMVKYIATNDKVKLNVGQNDDVKVNLILKDEKRKDIVVDINYYKTPFVKKYVTTYFFETEIINTLPYPVKVEIERSFAGEYSLRELAFKWDKVDKKTFRYYPDLVGNSKKIFTYQVDVKWGD